MSASTKTSHSQFKCFTILCLLVGVGVVAWAIHGWASAPKRGAVAAHSLSEWLNYHPPADQIVFFHDKSEFFGGVCTSEAIALMKTEQFDWNKTLVLCRDHSELDSYLASVGAKRNVYVFDPNPDALLFCGTLKSAAGDRFVLVNTADSGKWANGATKAFNFIFDVYSTGGTNAPLVNVATAPSEFMVGFFRHQAGDTVRIYAGQADPADPSHFTIAYSINDKRGLIDGNLQADGIALVFKARDGGPLIPLPITHKRVPAASSRSTQTTKKAFLAEQSNWMKYKAPADQLVMLQDNPQYVDGDFTYLRAVESDSLLEKNPDFTVSYTSNDANLIVGRVNLNFDGFLAAAKTARALPAQLEVPAPLLYLGERPSANGPRLIAVSFYCKHFWSDHPHAHQAFCFSADVFQPAENGRPLTKISSKTEIEIGHYRDHDNDVIRFFAGQSDPNDPTHFTIRYVMNGTEGFIDGNLQADGKTVALAARGGGPLIEKP
ncbi:MAG TPA: hypothetical protein VFE47_27160 [Tepidisphaeraceae bacterium]|jgi:hypothetical protein|nr:hypothetical protein [Tepidisphaeraceae bacterium]